MLDIQHLTKTYGEKKAVDDLSLRIAPGEIYGFIGHNGAGKTTTLKAAVGILQFDAGDIFIAKTIPDNPDLYDFMSGIQYLNFIADIFGIPAAERWARIEPLADAFELTGDLGQPVSAYSHGMKQKLAIIAAWIHDPKLILMDEPFSGSDLFNREDFYRVMLGLLSDHETVILSTHLLEEVKTFLSRAVLLRQGRLIGDISQQEMEDEDLVTRVKQTYHYQADRVRKALSQLPDEEG